MMSSSATEIHRPATYKNISLLAATSRKPNAGSRSPRTDQRSSAFIVCVCVCVCVCVAFDRLD